MVQRLKLSRAQLAGFLKDAESIKQFEKLFSVVDDAQNVGGGGEAYADLPIVSQATIAATLARIAAQLESIATTTGGDKAWSKKAMNDILTRLEALETEYPGSTKAWVTKQKYLSGTKVDSFNARTGAVTLTSGDVTTALTFTPVNKAGDSGVGAISMTALTATSVAVNPATGNFLLCANGGANARYGAVVNTSGSIIWGVESSGGGSLIAGSTGYDAAVTGKTGLAFSANDGSNLHARLASTGIFFHYNSVVMPKTSGMGIQVDTAAPTWGWRDIIGQINPKTVGAGTPALAAFRGNINAFKFVANDVIDCIFHMPHDYVPGSDIHLHIHWSHNGTAITGNVVFTHYSTYAKGHNQAAYPAEVTNTITYNTTNIATTPQYQHRIDEIQLSAAGGSAALLNTTNLEVDGLILVRVVLTTLPTITGGSLFINMIDVHYQSTNMATKQKAPPFWT